MTQTQTFFTYKGLPLVRKGKQIYYGNMSDEYVAMIKILSSHKVKELEVADKIKIFLMQTSPDINPAEAIVKTSDRNGLYEALDVASVWLGKRN